MEKKIITAVPTLQKKIDDFRKEEERLVNLAQDIQGKTEVLTQKIKERKGEK